MADDVIRRIRNKIPTTEDVSSTLLAEIEDELQRQPSAELWILRGDAIQLSDGNFRNLQDAEASYHEALAVDPESADAYESLGHFTYAIKDDARGALPFSSARSSSVPARRRTTACARLSKNLRNQTSSARNWRNPWPTDEKYASTDV